MNQQEHKCCCVCLSKIKFSRYHSIQTCEVCVNTHVCHNCFDVMRQTNIHRKCPVCRSENWCAHSDEVLIITDANPVSQPSGISISINISLDHEQQNTTGGVQVCLCKQRAKILIKGVACILIIWSIGFIIMSIVYNNFYQYGTYYVIVISFFVGTITSCFGLKCRSIVLGDERRQRELW